MPGPDSVEKLDPSRKSVRDPRFLFNRELSWLEFNRRVLELALDDSVPLLERLKFLAIFSTNLDEFFMIRVSGLKEQVAEGIEKTSPDGRTPSEQIREIRQQLRPMLIEQMFCLNEEIMPALAEEGIKIKSYSDLKNKDKERLDNYFQSQIFPILTPQAVDESHPFPYISNLSMNIGVTVTPRKNFDHGRLQHLFDESRFVRVKIPPSLPRIIPVNESATKFVFSDELITANISRLFPNMKTGRSHLFRVTRDADLEIREDEAGDLLRTMEQELLHKRRFSFPVRMEVESSMSEKMSGYIAGSIGLTEKDVYRINGFLHVPGLMSLYSLDRPDLKDSPISYSIPAALKTHGDIFETIKKQDIFVHHPYTSYSAVSDFLDAAAEDENVVAIKICLYRDRRRFTNS